MVTHLLQIGYEHYAANQTCCVLKFKVTDQNVVTTQKKGSPQNEKNGRW